MLWLHQQQAPSAVYAAVLHGKRGVALTCALFLRRLVLWAKLNTRWSARTSCLESSHRHPVAPTRLARDVHDVAEGRPRAPAASGRSDQGVRQGKVQEARDQVPAPRPRALFPLVWESPSSSMTCTNTRLRLSSRSQALARPNSMDPVVNRAPGPITARRSHTPASGWSSARCARDRSPPVEEEWRGMDCCRPARTCSGRRRFSCTCTGWRRAGTRSLWH